MNMFLYALAGATLVLFIFHGGRVYERSVVHEAQIAQFTKDAKRAEAIGAEDRKQQIRVVENIRTVQRRVPVDDCFNRPLSVPVLDGLRAAGLIGEGFEANR